MANKMYFVVRHTQTPRNPRNPQEGLMTNEVFNVTNKIKNKDNSEASIILDIAEQKVIKNRYSDRDFNDLYLYFMSHYQEHINKWIHGKQNKLA